MLLGKNWELVTRPEEVVCSFEGGCSDAEAGPPFNLAHPPPPPPPTLPSFRPPEGGGAGPPPSPEIFFLLPSSLQLDVEFGRSTKEVGLSTLVLLLLEFWSKPAMVTNSSLTSYHLFNIKDLCKKKYDFTNEICIFFVLGNLCPALHTLNCSCFSIVPEEPDKVRSR